MPDRFCVPHTNVGALEETLKVLRGTGRVEKVDSALIALCRTMAAEIDASDKPNAQLRQVYLDALGDLLGIDHGDNGRDDFTEAVFAALQHPQTPGA